MNMQVYTLCCHACGKIYDLQAMTLAIPMYINGPDGKPYGVRACEDCMKDGDRVKRAYDALVNSGFATFKERHWK